jgi:hypothetical protein
VCVGLQAAVRNNIFCERRPIDSDADGIQHMPCLTRMLPRPHRQAKHCMARYSIGRTESVEHSSQFIGVESAAAEDTSLVGDRQPQPRTGGR